MYYNAVSKADSFECLYLSELKPSLSFVFMLLFQNFHIAEVQQSEQFEERGIWSGRFGLLLPPISLHIGVTSLLWPLWVLCCLLRNSESEQGSLWHVLTMVTHMWHLPHSSKEENLSLKNTGAFFFLFVWDFYVRLFCCVFAQITRWDFFTGYAFLI